MPLFFGNVSRTSGTLQRQGINVPISLLFAGMKVVYQASNAVEAYMILHLLEQQGFAGRIDGEYLQGGVGELPATGFVRVMVPEDDHAAAKEIVDRWDAIQPAHPPACTDQKSGNGTGMLVLGLIAGILGTYGYFHAPAATHGSDHNRDGVLDEKWTVAADGAILERMRDRNFDGKMDMMIHHGQGGTVESVESDDDFNETFESRTVYRLGNPFQSETDSDGDGYRDLRTHFDHGALAYIEHIDPQTSLAVRIDYYRAGRLVHSDLDMNRDGTMDKRTKYNALGEVADIEKIP